ncbi:MAG: phosphate ABC transporter substrate-binding protein [Jaaginema sp. PMC 1079.18]|nr:phosphate ABC transporter substrate-binding protein [Jaaginema sp. PMC 1080.18]MEC4849948.1 phosphate ABC transporter substrate-binding protein [Jaaginema sp. PMC 1079.18]MEC4868817.1 phosphate ABC transporter substrate-binding protein [Jaaginema sp. PMC 1078.18]
MSQKNDTVTLIAALLITLIILGGGFWWLRRSGMLAGLLGDETANTATNQPQTPTNTPQFDVPNDLPAGTTLSINGSTSMVGITEGLKRDFAQQFANATVNTAAQGTDKGLQALVNGNADIAAISRPLTAQEQQQGLVAVPVAKDAIAIVVGLNNLFRTGLTTQEVYNIFTGQVNNWSSLGSTNAEIQVINRPLESGTRQVFQEMVLKGANFGSTPNFTTQERDATTPILRALGNNGISYATYTQVANQQTVRVVAIEGLTPEAANYPYQRSLSYVYQEPASPAVRAFLGLALSARGQEIINTVR